LGKITLSILQIVKVSKTKSPPMFLQNCQSEQSQRVAGGQSLRMAKPFWGVELAVRCERGEHGESQLFKTHYPKSANSDFLHVVKSDEFLAKLSK
jgi:hypothetical protein